MTHIVTTLPSPLSSPNTSPTCDNPLVNTDTILNDHDKHICVEDMIESYENPTSPTQEDIIGNYDVDYHDTTPFSSPTIFSTHEEDSLVLEDISSDTHEKLISPFLDPIIGNHETPSYPSHDASPMSNEAIFPNPIMTCDEHISSPTRVIIMAHTNEILVTIENQTNSTLNNHPMQAHTIPNLIRANYSLHDCPLIAINPPNQPSLNIHTITNHFPRNLSPCYIVYQYINKIS